MHIIDAIAAKHGQLTDWRRDIHAHPELAFEEHRTADMVADALTSFGLDVTRGLGKTGVVGTLSRGNSKTAVGLRADMDALPIVESNTFDYRSKHEGKMHACGHDGHTTMLLGAAQYMAANPNFDGTVHFIFQPAEEGAGGAKVMIEDGLFDQFPVDGVFGMHNWPGLEVGKFDVRTGAMMASIDMIDILIEGFGGHGALPHQTCDPVLAAAQVISAVQGVVSRNVNPLDSAVVSITMVHGGDAHNVIPAAVRLGGGIRTLSPESRDLVVARVKETAEGVCAGMNAKAVVDIQANYPVLINTPAETALSVQVASELVGAQNVNPNALPVMGSEDFAFMLQERPGCYIFIGNGEGKGGCMIHNPGYDFNDDVLPLGASYWVRLAETFLRA